MRPKRGIRIELSEYLPGGGSKNAMLSIDGPLCDALFAPRKGQPPPPEPRPTQMRLSDARTRFTNALEPFTRLSGGTLDKLLTLIPNPNPNPKP